MRHPLLAILALCMLAGALHAVAQTSPAESESKPAPGPRRENTVPIERLLETVARKTGRKFVVDPRVRAEVTLAGLEPSEITYPQLLTVLELYGFSAVDDGALVRVIPDANVRVQPVPTITARDTRPASECVTEVISLKYASASLLVPILRPLIPQYGHLAAVGNSLVIVDRFANVRRLEGLVRSLDTPENQLAPRKEPEH